MDSINERPIRQRRARRLIVACSVLLLSVAGCATGPQNALVNLAPYEAQRGERGNAAGSPVQVRIEPVREARGDAVGSLIGERKTIGDISMGNIELNPLPTVVMSQLLEAEFTRLGYSLVNSAEQFTIAARLRKFQVVTPATAMYWDINGAIELELAVTARNGNKHEASYAVTCTDRTYAYPSEEIIGKVVSACVGSMGTKVRSDATLAKFIGGR